MTLQKIKEVIGKAKATEAEKKVLLKQCIDKNPSALFAVYGLSIRQRRTYLY